MVTNGPSPADKLVLAVVHDPLHVQAAPSGAREEALRVLLQTAGDAGLDLVATRPDGDGERRLGQAWPFPSPFQVTVRTVPITEGVDRVEARARRSLERLGLPRGDVLLVSGGADLAGSEGRELWDRMLSLKDKGLYRRVGFCASMEEGPALLARRFRPDVIQLPCNLLDQRAERDGVLDELAALDVEIHLSSVFAGGLLFLTGDELPPHLAQYSHQLTRTRRRLAECRIDPMQAALAYAQGLPQARRVLVSVASPAEMRAVLAAAHAPPPNIDWSVFEWPGLASPASPRAFISSAA